MGHQDGTPKLVDDRGGDSKEPPQQDVDYRGEYRAGQKLRETSELQVQIPLGNRMLPRYDNEGVVGYDLCTANSYIIPSWVRAL